MSKKLEQKQQRRLAEERRRAERRREALRKNMVTIIVAVVVAAIVVVAIFFTRKERGLTGAPIGVSAAEANCSDVENYEQVSREHIDVGAEHGPYNSEPGTSGPHYEVPANTGFYAEELPQEQLIHNMEHGQIILWYSPELPPTTVDQIESLVDKQAQATVAVPYPDIEAPNEIVVTAWTASMTCEKISEAAINEFRKEFQGNSPEPLTPPFNG